MRTPTTIEELEELMRAPKETENLEFKAARQGYDGDKYLDYCVALANEGGGKFILGVTDTLPRVVCGTSAVGNPDKKQEKVWNVLHFDVRIEVVDHPDGRVVITHIPSRPSATPYNHDGRFLTRSGESLRGMSTDRLREIMNEGKPDWLGQVARDRCSAADVIRLLDTQAYYDLKREPYPTNQAEVLRRFLSEKLLDEDRYGYMILNIGAVLFAKRLDDFEANMSRKGPRVIVYEGTDKLNERKVFQPGAKGYAVGFSGLVDFIGSQLPMNEIMVNAIRGDVKMFPEVIIRELIANALIHQDFNEVGTSVTVEIYNDRMEISNPGKSVISPDHFIDENQSRNEKLADLMRRMGICEEEGKGIDKVIAMTEVCQLPPPFWRSSDRHTLAAVFAHKDFGEMDNSERVRACYQHCVLRYLTNKPMNNQSLRERFKLSDSKTEVVSAIIADTIAQGQIKAAGKNTSRRYAKYVPMYA